MWIPVISGAKGVDFIIKLLLYLSQLTPLKRVEIQEIDRRNRRTPLRACSLAA